MYISQTVDFFEIYFHTAACVWVVDHIERERRPDTLLNHPAPFLHMIKDWDKGIAASPSLIPPGAANILRGDVSLPAAVLELSALDGNIRWMQKFADTAGVKLAPHGKTTMCPKIFERQMRRGAWGMTLATAPQAAAAAAHGVKRIILANQLVGSRNMELVDGILDSTTFYCLVDSVDNLETLDRFFAARKRRLNVLIEVGTEQGRTGCRNLDQVLELANAISGAANVNLAGVEVYEGVIQGNDTENRILRLLERVVRTTGKLIENDLVHDGEVILTGAGSAWYDLVAGKFLAHELPDNVVPIIRPGSYVIHDAGMYRDFQNNLVRRCEAAQAMAGELRHCMEVWAYVQSIPEDDLAIIAMGKRDVGFSDGLPRPSLHYRQGWTAPVTAPASWTVTGLMDQHAFMRIDEHAGLAIGDMVSFGFSHPCLTCDKWRYFCVVDEDFAVLDHWPTVF